MTNRVVKIGAVNTEGRVKVTVVTAYKRDDMYYGKKQACLMERVSWFDSLDAAKAFAEKKNI